MSLPTTNITTSMVSSAIGLGSHDIGALCAKAKTGGTGGYAFNIVENGGATSDGTLITSAEPFFNKYSNESPGEWMLPASSTSPVYFRLKRSLIDSSRYAFMLGSFRGYDHSATPPSLPNVYAEIDISKNKIVK